MCAGDDRSHGRVRYRSSGGDFTVGRPKPVGAQDLLVVFDLGVASAACGARYAAECVGAKFVASALLAGAFGVCDRGAGGVSDPALELVVVSSVCVRMGTQLVCRSGSDRLELGRERLLGGVVSRHTVSFGRRLAAPW
jgi:hydrogenase/urease accessory protein HupE